MEDNDNVIIDPKKVDDAKRIGESRFGSFSNEQIRLIRSKAKHDLFFLASGLLGYDKLSINLHGNLCEWMRKTRSNQFREILLPRSHYKSTVVTIADSIQIVLTDDEQSAPYPRNLGPDCRVLIAHETQDAASRFLESITQHFTINPAILFFFPELVPLKGARLNKRELELPRSKIWSEPTFDTIGVGGKAQGRHYNYLKPDDIFGVEARDSETVSRSTTSWVNNLQSLLITPRTDHIDFVGTRYAFDDVYAHLHKTYKEKLIKYIRSCEEVDPVTGIRAPIFPEEFTTDSIEILKQDRQIWNAQYSNNPREGAASFQEEWLRFYNWSSNGKKLTVFDKNEESFTVDVDSLDKIILIDPAMNGLGGFVVTGTDHRNRVFILEAEKKTWTPPELVEKIFQSVIRWQPRLVVIEEVLFSGLFQPWLQREMVFRGRSFKLEPVKTGGKSKPIRVHGLSNYFSAGQIHFSSGMGELVEEFREFGATTNYHMLDALAYGPQFWRTGILRNKVDQYRKVEEEMLKARDATTGYSSY